MGREAKELGGGEEVVGKLQVEVPLDLPLLSFAPLGEAIMEVLPYDPTAIAYEVSHQPR